MPKPFPRQLQLPRIPGFSQELFADPTLPPAKEHDMAELLGNKRFQKGKPQARIYANLVVLFRMMLFYDNFKHHDSFWQAVAADWGIGPDIAEQTVRDIANLYSESRYKVLGSHEKRLSLLVRLVDEWLMVRPHAAIQYLDEVDPVVIQNTRLAWASIRDYHVDMLLESKHPACLRGVEPPSKTVTSLWEQDPAIL